MFSSTLPALTEQSFTIEHSTGAAKLCELASPPEGVVRVVVCDDIVGARADGSPAATADGSAQLMTDGAGLISLDLARLLPPVSGGRLVVGDHVGHCTEGSAPLVTQLRLWLDGSLAKGTLLSSSALSARLIVLRRRSMLKIDAVRGGARGVDEAAVPASAPSVCRFEICDTSEAVPRGRLNAALAEILASGARREGGQQGWDELVEYAEIVVDIASRRGGTDDGGHFFAYSE